MSVDHDLLADYVGGALEGTPEQARVATLIATSPEWGLAADELAVALHGVQNDLNLLRHTPEPMPEDVAARFEGLFDGLVDGPRRDPLEARVVTPRSRRPGQAGTKAKASRWKRWAAPAAIVAAALAVFAIGKVPTMVAPTKSDEGAASDTRLSAEAPGAVPQAPVPTVVTGRLFDRTNLQAAALANGAAADSAEPPSMRSSSGTTTKTNEYSSALTPWQRLLDPLALRQCLNTVTGALPGSVQLVEYAYFEGSPALVISITAADSQWRLVAGMNCGQQGSDERFRTPLK